MPKSGWKSVTIPEYVFDGAGELAHLTNRPVSWIVARLTEYGLHACLFPYHEPDGETSRNEDGSIVYGLDREQAERMGIRS